MKECGCGGIIGKICREGTVGECWLLWMVRDGSLEDGGENDLLIAKKFGKKAGLECATGHLSSKRDLHSYEDCLKRSEAIDAIKTNILAIQNLKPEDFNK